MPVLVVGSIGLDDIKTTTEQHKSLLGGSASYAAIAASFFAPVRLVGIVGHDFPAEHKQLFLKRKIDLTGLTEAAGETFRWSGEYEADMNNRQTLGLNLGVFENYTPKLPESFLDTDFILLANGAPQLQAAVLDQLKSPKFVVADTMDLWITIANEPLRELIKRVNLLILNDSEAKAFTGLNNVIKAGQLLRTWGPQYVVIKKGEHGAILFGQEGLFAIPAFPLEEVFDPTGAGDCFAGGLVGYCASKGQADFETLKKALVQGTLIASFNVESFSTRRLDRLTENDLMQRAENFRKIAGLA